MTASRPPAVPKLTSSPLPLVLVSEPEGRMFLFMCWSVRSVSLMSSWKRTLLTFKGHFLRRATLEHAQKKPSTQKSVQKLILNKGLILLG